MMISRFLFLVVFLTFTACAVGPDYKRPSVAVPAAYKEASPEAVKTLAKAEPKDSADRGKWWEVFGDAELNKLEEQIATSNQTVKAAEASFRQARALVAEARAAYFPTVGLDASATRNSIGTGAGHTSGSTLGGVIYNSYGTSLEASWVPDLWGKVRRQVESSKATAAASAAEMASVRLSAQGELAIDYLDLRIADEQKRLLDRTVEAYKESVMITENQYKSGVASESDVLQAKVQLETTEAQDVDVGVARAEYEHAIALLVGKAPADFSIAVVDNVPGLPSIPSGVPSELLERRPDVAAAERNVAAANAQIGVAESAYFPNVTLAADGGYTGSKLEHLFTLPDRFWSIGPSLVETIFDAGLRSAQTESAIASYDQTVANYRQTTLAAFQEVEDNLAALRIYEQEAGILETTVKDANESVAVFLNQYKAGIVNYTSVVTAQTAALTDELTQLTVRKERLNAAAMLIENLGGGWNASELNKSYVTQGKTTPFSILPPSVGKRD